MIYLMTFFIPVTMTIVPLREIAIETSTAYLVPGTNDLVKGSYALTTNLSHQKIKACLTTPLPKQLKLFLALEAPLGAVSLGLQELSTTSKVLVEGINPIAQKGLSMTYKLSYRDLIPPNTYTEYVKIFIEDE